MRLEYFRLDCFLVFEGVELFQFVCQNYTVSAKLPSFVGDRSTTVVWFGHLNAFFIQLLNAFLYFLAVFTPLGLPNDQSFFKRKKVNPYWPLAFAWLRSSNLRPSGYSFTPCISFPKNIFVFFKLSFKPKVRQDLWPRFSHNRYCLLKWKFFLSHDVRNNESGALPYRRGTLDMPAEQWTRMFPKGAWLSMT